MMTLRQRLLISVGVGLGILLVILLYLLYGRDQTNTDLTQSTVSTSTTTVGGGNGVGLAAQIAEEKIPLPEYSEEIYLRQLSKIFVERFSSYSSQNPNGNITDTIALASTDMQAWMKTQEKIATRDYEGVETEVLVTKVSEKTPTAATVAIEAQQYWESKKDGTVGATAKELRQRKGRVTLVKIGTEWKVDGLFWD